MENKKIMIVDDDKEFLDELKETLALSGYDLVAVNDADLVLDEAKKAKPAVILLDLKMPKKNGFQVADELRHFSELQQTPIIAMTAFFKEAYVPLMNICGIKKCLKKPFHPLDVITQIEEALGGHSINKPN
jgi:DNA-binding response OmpR family regulator